MRLQYVTHRSCGGMIVAIHRLQYVSQSSSTGMVTAEHEPSYSLNVSHPQFYMRL